MVRLIESNAQRKGEGDGREAASIFDNEKFQGTETSIKVSKKGSNRRLIGQDEDRPINAWKAIVKETFSNTSSPQSEKKRLGVSSRGSGRGVSSRRRE